MRQLIAGKERDVRIQPIFAIPLKSLGDIPKSPGFAYFQLQIVFKLVLQSEFSGTAKIEFFVLVSSVTDSGKCARKQI
jgi:hypothetical protein